MPAQFDPLSLLLVDLDHLKKINDKYAIPVATRPSATSPTS